MKDDGRAQLAAAVCAALEAGAASATRAYSFAPPTPPPPPPSTPPTVEKVSATAEEKKLRAAAVDAGMPGAKSMSLKKLRELAANNLLH